MAENISNGFVHTVFFWLKEPDNELYQQKLHEGLQKLSQISEIKRAYVGKPANTNRDVIDTTYNFSITFIFDNPEDQEIYQKHPDHLVFIEKCSQFWEKVQVYDAN